MPQTALQAIPSAAAQTVETAPPRRPLRVLMVVDGRYPATGGAEMQARLLSAAFAAAGHQVHVLVPQLDRSLPEHDAVDGVGVTRLPYPRIKGLGAMLLNLRFGWWLLRHQHAYDAIHIHMMHNLAGAAGWFKPWLKPRVIVKVSGAAEFQGGILDPALHHRVVHRLLRRGAQRLDGFQCISQRTARIMADAGFAPQRLHLVPNAVDVLRFQPAGQRDQSTLHAVFVGRHVPVKGLDVLLRAWAAARLPVGATLTLAGDGPETPRLMALAKTLGIHGSVRFPGLVTDVPALLAAGNLYVQASHQEGLPNAVLEAMASALPAVVTRVSGHEDVIVEGDNGYLVPANDPAALAAAIGKLAFDPAARQRMGAAARRYVECHFSTDRVLESLLAIYKEPV
ncbi:MAG: glycosyltransferase family 4 protein [Thiomonas sp.]